MRSFDSLRYRDYRILWSGAFLSNIGTWMQNVALSWYVLVLTGSPFWVGAINFANFIPTWLSPIGGVMADRIERKAILAVTQSVMMAAAATLALVASTGHANITIVIALTFLMGFAFAFNGPTWQAFVPSLVPREAMVNAIALNSAQFSMARVIGPAIAGVMVASRGAGFVFWINSASFVAVLVALGMIRTKTERRASVERPFAAMISGIRYAWRHPLLRAMIGCLTIVSTFAFPVTALLPVYAKSVFLRGSGGYGALASAMGIGSVFGALVLGRRGRTRSPLIFASLIALGVVLLAFSANRSYRVALALMVMFGATYLFTISSINSQIQTTVSDDFRGRVMSLFLLAFGGLAPIGSLIAGAVAEATSVRVPTRAAGALCVACGVALIWWTRREASATLS